MKIDSNGKHIWYCLYFNELITTNYKPKKRRKYFLQVANIELGPVIYLGEL